MSTPRRLFGTKAKFFRESEDFAGDQETWEICRETQSNQVKFLGSLRRFWEFVSSKISGPYSRFSGGLYLHMVLLKQDLLELSPPVS